MAGTIIGGTKARETNLKNNPDHYRRIGSLGGKASKTGSLPGKSVENPSKLSKFKVHYERTPADVDKRSIKNMLRLK